MMRCPECGTKCRVRASQQSGKKMWRSYHCACGTSFSTREAVTTIRPGAVKKPLPPGRFKMLLDAEKAARRGPWR